MEFLLHEILYNRLERLVNFLPRWLQFIGRFLLFALLRLKLVVLLVFVGVVPVQAYFKHENYMRDVTVVGAIILEKGEVEIHAKNALSAHFVGESRERKYVSFEYWLNGDRHVEKQHVFSYTKLWRQLEKGDKIDILIPEAHNEYTDIEIKEDVETRFERQMTVISFGVLLPLAIWLCVRIYKAGRCGRLIRKYKDFMAMARGVDAMVTGVSSHVNRSGKPKWYKLFYEYRDSKGKKRNGVTKLLTVGEGLPQVGDEIEVCVRADKNGETVWAGALEYLLKQ